MTWNIHLSVRLFHQIINSLIRWLNIWQFINSNTSSYLNVDCQLSPKQHLWPLEGTSNRHTAPSFSQGNVAKWLPFVLVWGKPDLGHIGPSSSCGSHCAVVAVSSCFRHQNYLVNPFSLSALSGCLVRSPWHHLLWHWVLLYCSFLMWGVVWFFFYRQPSLTSNTSHSVKSEKSPHLEEEISARRQGLGSHELLKLMVDFFCELSNVPILKTARTPRLMHRPNHAERGQ